MDERPEPRRVLQLYSWENQAAWQSTSAQERFEWLEFVILAAWAGAAARAKRQKDAA